MPYNFVTAGFYTKKLCSRLSSREVQFYMKNCHFAFLSPSLGSLVTTYDVHLRLIGKRIVDFKFLLVFIELLYGWGTTSENRLKIGISVGQFNPKFLVQGVILHQPFFLLQNWNDVLSYDVRILAEVSSFVLSQFTCFMDWQTDICALANTHMHCCST